MLGIAIIASGREYQTAAGLAAATYTRQLASPAPITVWLPEAEPTRKSLKLCAQRFGFAIRPFPFRPVSEHKFTSQLKCQGFVAAVTHLPPNQLLFLVDADTCCLKPLRLPTGLANSILAGRIGLAPDIEDRHFQSPIDPWYLTPEERLPYVNTGVILTARNSLDLFEEFREMSGQPRFLHGPFNDQKVINFALGKNHPNRLVLLGQPYNGIHLNETTIIAHCAGGAGWFGPEQSWRKVMHRKLCAGVLGSRAD